MPTAVVTGSGGLVGSSAVRRFVEQGYDVVGVENDLRAAFFGPAASTAPTTERLIREIGPGFRSLELDIRDRDGIDALFGRHAPGIDLVLHAAAQPSHDWAASDPHTDFAVNATGTLNLLEACRTHCPDATFVFCSTNKVYGDRPNELPLEEQPGRLELPREHPYHGGIDTTMPIDRSLHSLFGASKAAADLLVQEYGRYFGMPTVCFRAGCITGASHAGAPLHGFLAYLMRCTVTGELYEVLGYDGKQVRDNIHADDLVAAFAEFHRAPVSGAVYNIGGGRGNSCSLREAIALCEQVAGRDLRSTYVDEPRIGDHRWWISDLEEFRGDYPQWSLGYDVPAMLQDIFDANVDRWTS